MESLQGRGDFTESTIEHQNVKWSIGNQRARNMLEVEAVAMATSHSEECIFIEGQREKRILNGISSHLAYPEQMQRWDGHQRIQPAYVKMESPRIEGQSGQGQRFEVRSGPGARWAHKTGLETRWTSPEKVPEIVGLLGCTFILQSISVVASETFRCVEKVVSSATNCNFGIRH